MKIGILYPRISHYREEFFEALMEKHKVDYFIYESSKKSEKSSFKNSKIKAKQLASLFILKKIRFINILPLFNKNYDILILIGEMRSPSIWALLLLFKYSKTRTILWGHGISTHSYIEEQKKLLPMRVVFHKLADHNWLYTGKEVKIWENEINSNKFTALNNTINIEEILDEPIYKKSSLKKKHGIDTEINFIFCSRFSDIYRRTDLMIEVIEKLDSTKYGFIIIGDGDLKPDFSIYENVYDFGLVYDRKLKTELFQVSDIYFQAGWVGLSCNEALAYGKMVLTFKRSKSVSQGVEYGYLNNENSYTAKDVPDLIAFVNNLKQVEMENYNQNARAYASNNLRMEVMVSRALDSLERINS